MIDCDNFGCECYLGFGCCGIRIIERKFLIKNFNVRCPDQSYFKSKKEYQNMIKQFLEFRDSLRVMQKLRGE